jgi:hypothetical protein
LKVFIALKFFSRSTIFGLVGQLIKIRSQLGLNRLQASFDDLAPGISARFKNKKLQRVRSSVETNGFDSSRNPTVFKTESDL